MTSALHFDNAVADIEEYVVRLQSFLAEAKHARQRSWIGELPHCSATMSKVQMVARQIVQTATDAEVECSIAMGEFTK